jgi:hypothetical protein
MSSQRANRQPQHPRQRTRRARPASVTARSKLWRWLGFESLEDRNMLTALTVSTTVDDASISGSLRYEVAQANADAKAGISDTIAFAAALKGDTLTLSSGALELGKNGAGTGTITIDGGSQITLSGGSASGVFLIDTSVLAILTGLTITGGAAAFGGGVVNSGTLTISNSTITGNTATGNGGGIFSPGALTVTNCTLSNNAASGSWGGGIIAGGTLIVNDSTFSNNTAGTSSSAGYGGAIYLANTSTATIGNSTISGNSVNGSGYGGGIANYGTVTFNTCNLSSGNAAVYGGGLYNDGTATLAATSTLSNNAAARGGGAYNQGTLTINNSTVAANSTGTASITGYGGGIYNVSGALLTINSAAISGNTAFDAGVGGGIYNQAAFLAGAVTLSNSTVSGNFSEYGAGLANYGDLTVSNSTVSTNSQGSTDPTGFGGGIFTYAGSVTTVSDSTISGNVLSGANSSGGGIYNQGALVTSDATISANSVSGASSGGGGIYTVGGIGATTTLLSSVVAGNSGTDPDVDGAVTLSSYSLIGDRTGMSGLTNGTSGNQAGSATTPLNPMLGSLQLGSGPTPTLVPLASSPVINAGGALTTLAAAVATNSITSVAVNLAIAIASTPGKYVIQIDSEQMLVTNVNLSNYTLLVQRGYNGTAATTHNSGANVYLAFDQRGLPRQGTPDAGAVESQATAPPVIYPIMNSAASALGGGTLAYATMPTISDPNIAGSGDQLQLAVTSGALTVPAVSGVAIVAGSSGGNSLTVQGSMSQLDAALMDLIYTPSGAGSATLSITPVNPSSGSGGTALSGATSTVIIAAPKLTSYTVDQIRAAYGINSIPNFGSAAADGTGQTIAIVDADNDPSIFTDLDGFDAGMVLSTGASKTLYAQYGAASSFLTVYNQAGTNITSLIASSGSGGVPALDPTGSWESEETLDIEWAHAIAPGAKIDLIETSDATGADGLVDGLFIGAATAASLPGVSVVSLSWTENASASAALAFDASTFMTPVGHPGVTFLAGAGDGGVASTSYPAASPNVVAVGGTSLYLSGDTYTSENGWSFPQLVAAITKGSSAYSQSGAWSSGSGGFSGAYGTAAAGSGSTATWTSTITAADQGWGSGTEVSATWVASAGNATNARYSIYDGNATTGTLLGTVTVDQTKAPVGTLDGSAQFQELGQYTSNSGTLTVVLNAGTAGGTVVADAVGIAPAWATGGGQSSYETQPTYQTLFQSTGKRTIPDVSFDGANNTGVTTYENGTWIYGNFGTSLATPCWAGLIAIVNQGRAAAGGLPLDSATSPTQTLQALYSLPAGDFNDVTVGYNGASAGAGYDQVSGRGTPIASTLVPDLVAYALADQIVVTTQPPATVTAGATFPVTIEAEDQFGALDSSASGSVSVGGVSGTFVNGVATVNVTLTKAGNQSLAVTGDQFTTQTSTFTVLPGAASQIVFTTPPPSTIAAGSGLGVVAAVEDAAGNIVTSFTGNVAIALGSNPGNSTLGGTTTVSASGGVAIFANLNLNKVASGYTLQATASTLPPVTSATIAVTPGTAAQFVVTAQPPANVTAGANFGLTLTAEDADGNVATGFSGSVTISFVTNPGGSTLGGTTTLSATAGVVVFTNLTLNSPTSAYQLSATGSGLPVVAVGPLNVTPLGVATHLVVPSPPTVPTGATFAVTVKAEDDFGTVDTSFSGSVAIALSSNPALGTLGGTLVMTASAGAASFADLTLDTPGAGYVLQVASSGLTAGTTAPFSAVGTLTISGSASGNDVQITFTDPTDFNVVVNGGAAKSYSTTTATRIVYDGPNGTRSTLAFSDTFNTYTATLSPSGLQASASGYTVSTNNCSATTITGTAADTANLTDATGNNRFYGHPTTSILINTDSGTSYTETANGFGTVNVISSSGGDSAYLYDAAGANTFVGYPTYATLTGSTYGYRVNAFPVVFAYQQSGTDTAYLYDSAGGTYNGFQASSVVSGMGYYNYVSGFQVVEATMASVSDQAFLYDTSGNNVFERHAAAGSTPNYSVFYGTGFYNLVSGSLEVTATAGTGTTDQAYISDNTNDGRLYSFSTYVTLANTDVSTFFNFKTNNFGDVAVTESGTSSSETAYQYDTKGGDRFYGQPTQSSVAGLSYWNVANGFGAVFDLSAGGGNDSAYLYDAKNNGTFYGHDANSVMQGTGYYYDAVGVRYVFALSAGGNTAFLADTVGGNFFEAHQAYSVLYNANTLYIYATGFATVNASGTGNHGTDTAFLYDSPGNDQIIAAGDTAQLVYSAGNVANVGAFANVAASSTLGGTDKKFLSAVDYNLSVTGGWT